MIETIQLFIASVPRVMPTLIIIIILWVLAGWFYAEILGREIHDFIVASILILIVLFTMIIFVNRDIQMLFFGSY